MRRKFALIIAALILNLSIITSYVMPVNAMPVGPLADGLYDTFSKIFGYALGTYKDLNELGYNYQLSQMQDFIDSQINGEAYSWENNEAFVIQDINKYENFVDLMQSSLATVQGYNTGTVSSSYFDALNKRSYTSSGTMATVTLEQKLLNGLALLETMGKVNFEMNFENFRNTLFGGTDESGAAIPVTNLATNYELYEALTSSLMTMSAYDSTNEYFTPVSGTSYNYSNLNNGNININGVLLGYSYANRVYVSSFYYQANIPVFYFKFKDGFIAMSDSYFQIARQGFSPDPITTVTLNGKQFYYFEVMGAFNSNQLSILDYRNPLKQYYSLNMCGNSFEAQKISSVGGMTPGLTVALDAFLNKDLTADDMVNLADDLDAVSSSVGTEQAIQDITDVINGITVTLPDAIVDGKNDVVTAVDGLGEVILTLPKAIWKEFAGVLEDINSKVGTQAQTKPWEGDLDEDSPDILPIFNALIILLQIIIALLKIFIHCLQFIINIFAIQPSSAMLPEEMVMGLEYINTIQIPGLGMSVYSFMMGLVYITIVFFAIRILRVNVDRIKIPKKLNGGL